MNKGGKSVLVVDDEYLNIMTLTDILSPEFTVYATKNGRDAIKVAGENLPDVILLDILMSDIDGYSVITSLKKSEKTRDIPVIFISGLKDCVNEEVGFALGASDYIHKPFSKAIVRLRVKNQIKMLEQLRASKYGIMRYELACKAMNVALWDMKVVVNDPTSPENKITWSRELRHMLGFTDENDFPNTIAALADRLHPDDREQTFAAFAAHFNDSAGKTPYDVEYRLRHKNGEYRYFDDFGATMRDGEGNPLLVSGAVKDITEKKRIQERYETP